jgi:hypothetical protein
MHYSLIRALTVTVRADNVALLNLSFDSTHRHVIDVVHFKNFLFTFTMIEVHNVIRVLNAAIGARLGFNLM